MGSGIFFPICALPIILIIILTFNLKKHITSQETKLYNLLIITNFVGLIIEIACKYACMIFDENFIFASFILKSYLVYLISWTAIFTTYIFRISLLKVKMIYIYIHYFCLLITVVCIYILPIEVVAENNFQVHYTIGASVDFSYLISFIYILIILFILIKNYKNLKNKKYLPVFMFFIIGTIAIVIQKNYPQYLLLTYSETIICLCMYFTIENPDFQMLREFHKQREYAEESNQEKSTFLFNMSNQVKQPIELINKISSEALIENDIEQIKEDVRQIKSSSNDLYQIVNNILDISELEQRKIEIRGNRYHVYNLFNVINKTFEKSLNKNIEYRFNYDRSIPEYLYGDSIRLKQIMNILLDNAKEYTNNGFIEVNINSIVKHDVCRLIITVEDSGIGMTTDQIKHLFDKGKIYSDELLKTIDDTKNNLGILKSLVNLMNGNVMVSSEYGKGSKFTVVIDQKQKEEKTKIIETVERYEEMYENNDKVMFVINTEDTNKKLKKYFKKYNVDITEVKGGQACLERVRNNEKYDLIIMEENLPKLSSEDTLIKLKDTVSYKTPVVLITSKKEIDTKDRYIEKGYSDVIFLPFRKEQVIKVIEEYIEK